MACAGSVCTYRHAPLVPKAKSRKLGHRATRTSASNLCAAQPQQLTTCCQKAQPQSLGSAESREVLNVCVSVFRRQRFDSQLRLQPCLCCQREDGADEAQIPESDGNHHRHENLSITAGSWSAPTRVAVSAISAYKSLISPLLPNVCRFQPTCSSYGIEAYEQFGAVKGSILLVWRLLRCNPFRGGYQGQYDPPAWPPVGLDRLFGAQ